MNKTITIFLIFVLLTLNVSAKGVYMEPEVFLEKTFVNNVPKSKTLWIKKDLKAEINNIMGHDLGVIRLRYWDSDNKTAWILEEIGRDKPITVGLVISERKIEQVNVLIFRESRGWEVKYPFFTDQFKQAKLTSNKELDRNIDGISGATLSVNALKKLARLALFLDAYVSENK